MSLSPLIRARFWDTLVHTPLLALPKSKVHAIGTYVEALFPAADLLGQLLELCAPLSSFRVSPQYITRRGTAYTARTGLPFP